MKYFFKIFNKVTILIITLFGLFPFIWLIISSFKTQKELYQLPIVWLPRMLNFENYLKIKTVFPIVRLLLNTTIVGLSCAIIVCIISTSAAYAIVRFKNKGTIILIIALLFAQTVPEVILVVPYYFLLFRLHLSDSLIGLTIAYLIWFIPFGTLMMRSYIMSGYPKALEDSAQIDGANDFQIITKIVMPLCAPAIVAVGLFTFIGIWNEFMWASVLILDNDLKTIQSGVYRFFGQWSNTQQINVGFAAGTIIVLPIIFITFYIQKYMVAGLTSGAIKE